MKTKLFARIGASAAAAVTALFSFSTGAQAFSFGNDGISFDNDTIVDFTFLESHGGYQSALGIYSVDGSSLSKVADLFAETKASDNGYENGWKGTLGDTVQGSGTVSYKFLANKIYTLGLASTYYGSDAGTVYSTAKLNPYGGDGAGSQQAVFGSTGSKEADGTEYQNPAAYYSANPFTGSVAISFDDRGNVNDKDFQDFSVRAQAKEVPEPLTLGGLALGAGGMAIARLRRRKTA